MVVYVMALVLSGSDDDYGPADAGLKDAVIGVCDDGSRYFYLGGSRLAAGVLCAYVRSQVQSSSMRHLDIDPFTLITLGCL